MNASTTLVYDGSFNGFLTAVFVAFDEKINVADMKSYREFMLTKLTTINNIGNTQSSFVISEVKNTPSVHIG